MPSTPNTPITKDDVRHMAALARLDVDASTQDVFAKQFGDILTYMQALSQVDTEGVEPLYSPTLHASPVRPDVATNRRQREDVLHNAPEQNGEYFVVPRIV